MYARITTRVLTTPAHSWPFGSRSATPVSTSCARPRSASSISVAAAPSAGLPSAAPSRATTVSAPITIDPPADTARALASATLSAASSGSPREYCPSSRSVGAADHSSSRSAMSAWRRGDAEARSSRGGVRAAYPYSRR